MKTKDTPTQHSIKNKSKRLQNLRGAYAVKNPEKILGQNIILIDDITTTNTILENELVAQVTAGESGRSAEAKLTIGFGGNQTNF
jgi:orotate phosphoribosyltransferase-like protein